MLQKSLGIIPGDRFMLAVVKTTTKTQVMPIELWQTYQNSAADSVQLRTILNRRLTYDSSVVDPWSAGAHFAQVWPNHTVDPQACSQWFR